MSEDNALLRVGSYSIEELEALVEGYEELRYVGDTKAWVLVRLCDLSRAFNRLDRNHQRAVLLMGMYGLTSRAAASYLGVSHTTVANRYRNGLQAMQNYLNRSTSYRSQTLIGGKRLVSPQRAISRTTRLPLTLV